MPTPYDGRVAVWYVHGRTVGESTIEEMISTLRTFAPAVNAVFVKVGEASEWMGSIGAGDPKPDLAIRGPADLDRWIAHLDRAGIAFHAWAIPKGNNPAAEADFLAGVCSRPGVRSLILDVEPFEGYFAGGRSAVRPLMSRLRGALPSAFHIGMSVDPRPWHYETIFPEEWRPYLNSLHPQVYWADFSRTPDDALRMTYDRWAAYGLPIIPVLQAYQGRGEKISRESMERARNLAITSYKAVGLSWFRFGTLTRSLFPAINMTIAGGVPTPPDGGAKPAAKGKYGVEIVVRPGDAGYLEGAYEPDSGALRGFQNEEGRMSRFAQTSATASNAWGRWEPNLPESGFWEISVYVPSQHGSTRNARYKIHGILGQNSDFEVAVPQATVDSTWVSLGVFSFEVKPGAGIVFLNDLTGENGREISFDALRWRQVLGWTRPPRYVADGFDAPVGSSRARDLLVPADWPDEWVSTNPFRNLYTLGGKQSLHTGDDLVLKKGKTLGQPLYAVASGEVVSAKREGRPGNWGSWGNVIVIRHDPLVTTGQVVYSRYGHVDSMQVGVGDRVVRGQHIANIGDAYGVFRNVPHLHFDISPSRVLETTPGDWPWLDGARLDRDYANPHRFIFDNRPAAP